MHHYKVHSNIESIIRDQNHSENLDKITITSVDSDKLIWFKDGREFSYKGHMYDIVRMEKHPDGSIVYHCFKDEKEKEIYRNIESAFNHSSPAEQHDRTLVLQIFKILSNVFIPHLNGTYTFESETLNRNFIYLDKNEQTSLSVSCEPPDLA